MHTLSWFHRRPLFYSLLLGLVLRLFAGTYVNTPIQEDDHAHVIRPALKAIQVNEEIKTREIRLRIWPIIFHKLLLIGKSLGFQKTSHLKRIIKS